MHWGAYGWGMGYGGVFMIVFWVLVAAGVAFLVRSAMTRNDCTARKDAPIDILNTRYAKGELTREEFVRMKGDLKKA